MPHIVLLLAGGVLLVALGEAWAGPGLLKKRPDATRIPTLMETLHSDPDEKKRKAAAEELGHADSRLYPEVATALVVALQKDTAAAVRAEAAYALGQLRHVFAIAGQALEEAADRDSSFAVRFAAKRTLWEYHLMGYRSAQPADPGLTQTEEPPLASPTGPRNGAAVVRVSAPVARPPEPLIPPLPERAVATPSVPLVTPPVGPRLIRSLWSELVLGVRSTARTPSATTVSVPGPPPVLNLTHEPPLAPPPIVLRRPVSEPVLVVPPPTIPVIPQLPELPRWDYIPQLPPLQWEPTDLPPVVPDPAAPSQLNDQPSLPSPKWPAIPATLPPRQQNRQP